MSLNATNLIIQMSPLSPTFAGTPQDLANEMLRRMKILSPSGVSFISTSDTMPASNVGPWLKGGTQWYVWDETLNTYVPLDISPSFTIPFWQGLSVPAGTVPPVWLKTTKDPTDIDPTVGSPVSWYVWDGTAWVGTGNVVLAGPTVNRPASPDNLQQYYDTDITALIWWERSMWRTVSGQPGDVKFVLNSILADALTINPGWQYIGLVNSAWRGRVLTGATQDPGATPVAQYTPVVGVTGHAAGDTFGESTGLAAGTDATIPPQLALWTLVKL